MNRVECTDCKKFILPIMEDEENLMSSIIVKAKCELGKRVLFQSPKTKHYYDTGGYFRYCDDFEQVIYPNICP